jgi:hypothetical protein
MTRPVVRRFSGQAGGLKGAAWAAGHGRPGRRTSSKPGQPREFEFSTRPQDRQSARNHSQYLGSVQEDFASGITIVQSNPTSP